MDTMHYNTLCMHRMHNNTHKELLPLLLQTRPKYNYTPSDFQLLSVLTVAICGFLCPPTLTLSIPALLYSIKVIIADAI